MAMTLVEANKFSKDVLLQGVIETVIKDSPILQMLPFIEIIGNGLTYNRENTMATAAFYDVGDAWTESTPTFTQLTAVLKIIGGDADVDNFLKSTRSNIQDLEAAIIQLKAKAVQHKFEDTFVNGSIVADAKSFDGITSLCIAGQTVEMAANGAALTLDKMDELIDKIMGGKPHLLLMSKRSRRKLSSLRRASGTLLETDTDQFGQRVTYYDGIPIGVSDWVSDVQVQGSSGALCSSIHALQFGEGAVSGLSSPGNLQVERIGSLETKDATRTRLKWYASLAVFNALKNARLIGIL